VPSSGREALMSNLIGILEKTNVVNLYNYVRDVDFHDKSTWDGVDIEN